MPQVSVIIPAYNSMEYLPKTLDTVLCQTFTDFEVIIVDDGSTDSIKDWVKEISDARVRLISQPNQGASRARNNGISNAAGEFIAFLDSDDLWEPTKLEKQLDLFVDAPELGLVYTWVASVDENGKPRGRILKNFAEGKVWQDLVQHNVVECGSTPMIRRSCFDEVGLFDENLTNVEDRDMWLRISCKYDFAVVKEALVSYRQRANSKGKNYQMVEKSASLLLKNAFNSPPSYVDSSQLEELKRQSYGMTYLRLAWKPLKCKQRDHQTAAKFRRQAMQYDPKVVFRKDFIRLTIAIQLMQLLGIQKYDRIMALIYQLRRNFLRFSA